MQRQPQQALWALVIQLRLLATLRALHLPAMGQAMPDGLVASSRVTRYLGSVLFCIFLTFLADSCLVLCSSHSFDDSGGFTWPTKKHPSTLCTCKLGIACTSFAGYKLSQAVKQHKCIFGPQSTPENETFLLCC